MQRLKQLLAFNESELMRKNRCVHCLVAFTEKRHSLFLFENQHEVQTQFDCVLAGDLD